jgi:hypothetical protein
LQSISASIEGSLTENTASWQASKAAFCRCRVESKKGRVLACVKYWEIIADNLSKAGWSLGWVSVLDCEGRTIWIVDAHRYGKRFIVRADELLTAFLELQTAIHEFAVNLIL